VLNHQTAGIITQGLITIRHEERNAPLLTFPRGTYWYGRFDCPEGVTVDFRDAVVIPCDDSKRELAQLETLRWQTIITSPMPTRVLMFLEFVGGGCRLLQPEIADLICVSQDCLKRAVSHYRALGRLRTNPRGLWLLPSSSRIGGEH
jgi:hypothetical protein